MMKTLSDKIRIEDHSAKKTSLTFQNVNVIQNKKAGDCFKLKEIKET